MKQLRLQEVKFPPAGNAGVCVCVCSPPSEAAADPAIPSPATRARTYTRVHTGPHLAVYPRRLPPPTRRRPAGVCAAGACKYILPLGPACFSAPSLPPGGRWWGWGRRRHRTEIVLRTFRPHFPSASLMMGERGVARALGSHSRLSP